MNYAGVNVSGSAYRTRAYVNGTSSNSIVIPGYNNQPNVMYKTHVQSFGWQNWKLNGDCSGTFGKSKRLEGIQILLVPKGAAAPASNYGGMIQNNPSTFIAR